MRHSIRDPDRLLAFAIHAIDTHLRMCRIYKYTNPRILPVPDTLPAHKVTELE